MSNLKTIRRALISSVLTLFLCFSMLLGTTFAWFTDSVTSSGNIIQAGNLDVGMYWANGAEAVPTDDGGWKDASADAIFNYTRWEPGFSEAKHIKITNEGSLALNYQLRIVANGTVGRLADVIDVYYFSEAKQLTRAEIASGEHLGTLAEVLGTSKNISQKVKGTLDADTDTTLTLVFKMQESAGDEYQNQSIGTNFSIELVATQSSRDSEKDSFGADYDAVVPSPEVPAALVRPIEDLEVSLVDKDKNAIAGYDGKLDSAYQFQPIESSNDANASAYSLWHADFVVYADREVPANSMLLAGYYKEFDTFMNLNGAWIGMTADGTVSANSQVRLLRDGLGVSVNYSEIGLYGNDDIGFLCGVEDLTGENAGTTLTVELRLYETKAAQDTESNTSNEETGNYVTVGKFVYTFEPSTVISVATAAELQAALDSAPDGSEIKLTADITGNAVITQREGVSLTLNGNGKQIRGVLTVFGNGNQSGTEALAIRNVHFVAVSGADSCIVSPDRSVNNKYSYSHNVTVENCTFTDPEKDLDCAAIRHGDGGDKYWTVKDCTVNAGMHSFLQVNNVVENLIIDNCVVKSKNGVNLNSTTKVSLNNSIFDVTGYAVRFGVGSGGNLGEEKLYVLEENVLKSACADGDAVIMFRASAVDATLKLSNTVLVGTTEISGATVDTVIVK